MTTSATHPAEKTLAAWIEAVSANAVAGAIGGDWLRRFRAEALDALGTHGLPGPREDAWRHMGVDTLLGSRWRREADNTRLDLAAGTSGVELRSWEDLGRLPEPAAHRPAAGPLARLNAVLLERAVHVRVAKNVCCLRPLRIEPAVTDASGAGGWMIHPRASVLLEPGSRLDVVVDLGRLPDTQGLMNLVMDIELCEQTALNLVVAGATGRALSLLDLSVVQRRDSVFRFYCLETRPQASRLDLNVSLQGGNASTDLFGLALLGEASRAFHHIRVDHKVPHTQSQQIFKSVLSGEARYEYDSLVTIDPAAPASSSEQLNRNLILSDAARAFARPQLAIHTDDVQCHHGATVGQMNAAEELYLRTRGISPADASALILRGFVDDLLKEIPVPSVSADLQGRAHARLREIVP